MTYKLPSWANWKKLTDSQLAQADIVAAEQEMERVLSENTNILTECIHLQRECIKLAIQVWGEGSNEVRYLKRASAKFPPPLRKLLNQYRKAVATAKAKLKERAKGKEAYQRRKAAVKRNEEIDQYILERYGAGWEEQG